MPPRAMPILPNPTVPFTDPKTGQLTRDGRAFLQAMINAFVVGPTSATDGAAVLFDGTSGQRVKE